jgi:hypothetical protein
MVMKTQGLDPAADDYEVHEAAVAACRQRGLLSEQMQRELDQRHRLAVEAFRPAKSETALAALWADALGRGDVVAALWAVLSEVAEHVVWHGRKLSPEDWKHVFTASLKRMDVVPNLEGTGFVALGLSTSKMSKREFSDLLELVNAFAAERIEVTA